MLHQFLFTHRDEILERTHRRVITRTAPRPTADELSVGIPRFLDELIALLRGGGNAKAAMHRDATCHGWHRQRSGTPVAQVVHDYGDLCQAITELAVDLDAPIDAQEFKTLNGCLDDAIAHAVTKHAKGRESGFSDHENERLGFLAHELRNHLQAASLAFQVLKSGTVGIGGSTGAVLGRSLAGLQTLVDRTIAQVRLEAGGLHLEPVGIASFLEEVEAAGSILAQQHHMSLTIDSGDPAVTVEADRQLLGSAVANLLQNAFKFSLAGGNVAVRTTATADRVRIDVADECGGVLGAQQVEGLFAAFAQHGSDRTGVGLGLAISKEAIQSMRGTLHARNLRDVGCVFTIDLPRLFVPPQP